MKTTIKNTIFAFGLVFSSLCMASGYVGYDASAMSFSSQYAYSKHNLVNHLSAGYLKEYKSSLQFGLEVAYYRTGKLSVEGTSKLDILGIQFDDQYVGSFTYQGSTALGLMHYQFASKWHAVVKGGAEFSHFKVKTVVNQSTTYFSLKTIVDNPTTYFESTTDIRPIVGIGIQYKVLPQFSLNANYYRFPLPSLVDSTSSYGSLGLRYHWA